MLKFICSKFVYLDGKDEVSACFPVSLPHGMGGCNHVLPHTLRGTCGVHMCSSKIASWKEDLPGLLMAMKGGFVKMNSTCNARWTERQGMLPKSFSAHNSRFSKSTHSVINWLGVDYSNEFKCEYVSVCVKGTNAWR